MRVLLTEGSSLTAREVISCLGPLGYHLEVLDPDTLCLARFSRWVSRVHRSPRAGTDPLGYIESLGGLVKSRGIDVVLPTHEQAWLLAAGRALLPKEARIALSDLAAFEQVQSKVAFARLLDELGLPQPPWRALQTASDLADLPYPYWLKSAFSTAGAGVHSIVDEATREAALNALSGEAEVMAQLPAPGQYGQVQGLFDCGRLVAAHTSVQAGTGVGGSAAARISVDHPLARKHMEKLGERLQWHGGLTLDYLHEAGSPVFIECNPRTVEPGNAAASGVNVPDLQVRLTLGERLPGAAARVQAGVRTHGAIALLLGAASRGEPRRALVARIARSLGGRGSFPGSAEQLTPWRRDPPSMIAATFVAMRVLQAPARAADFAARAVAAYSVGPAAVAKVRDAAAEVTA